MSRTAPAAPSPAPRPDRRTELLAGATTFVTMAYIIVVNPAILAKAGLPRGPAMTATILAAAVGTLLMGLYARRPFAVAPYMGENAFVAFTVVGMLGFTWQQALGAVLLGGVLFVLLTVTGARAGLARALPGGLKAAFVVGIGLFLAFVGLNETGLVTAGVPGAPVRAGDLGAASSLLALGGLLLMVVLMQRRVPGALLLGILVTTLAGMAVGAAPWPERLLDTPPDIRPVLLQVDLHGALSWRFLPVVLTVFVLDFVDTMGTLIGVGWRAGLLDEHGNLPDMDKPLLCDAVATVAGALLGTTTTGTYIESAAGVEAGGRTGLTAVTTGLLFLAALWFAPLLTAVPAFAYGPALIVVGMQMLGAAREIDTGDVTELAPAFLTVAGMVFTYNLGVGLTAGLLLWPLLKLLSGRAHEVPGGMWALGGLAAAYYLFGVR